MTASEILVYPETVQVDMSFFSTLTGMVLWARITTSLVLATASVLRPIGVCRIWLRRSNTGRMISSLVARMSATDAVGSPCTRIICSLTMMTRVWRGLFRSTESGSLISLGGSSTSTADWFTSRKNTRMVNTSISDVRFRPVLCFLARAKKHKTDLNLTALMDVFPILVVLLLV